MKNVVWPILSVLFCHLAIHAMENNGQPLFEISVALSMRQGARKYMEDRAVMFPNAPRPFFSVYDGHCGTDAIEFAAQNLPEILKKKLAGRMSLKIPEILKQSFEELDQHMKDKEIKAGSTALVALLENDQLYVAWAGDSRALVIRNNTIILETADHVPLAAMERDRIEKHGCTVLIGRDKWNGTYSRLMPDNFAMSRALGNHQYGCKQKGAMIAIPEVVSITIQPNDMLVLGSDGLFDDLQMQTIVKRTNAGEGMFDAELHHYNHKKLDPNEYVYEQGNNAQLTKMASCLRDEALQSYPDPVNSSDNITVMLAEFKAKQSQ